VSRNEFLISMMLFYSCVSFWFSLELNKVVLKALHVAWAAYILNIQSRNQKVSFGEVLSSPVIKVDGK